MKRYNTEGKIETPIGFITVPGFPEADEMSDEDLVAEMNSAPFVDPVRFQVASKRFTLAHDYCHLENRYRWWTRAAYEARPAASKAGNSFTSIITYLAS